MKVVYVCSPDWEHYLFTSIQSLLLSGTSFEEILIYCVGNKPSSWNFEEMPISVVQVPNLNDKLWFFNKIHICKTEAHRVAYLDADTIVLSPLDSLFDQMEGNIGGRVATATKLDSWDPNVWNEYLGLYGGKRNYPYLCAGVVLFDNGCHKNIKVTWPGIAYDIYSKSTNPFIKRDYSEQQALSIAAAVEQIDYHTFGPRKISHGWEGDNYKTTIFHAGSGQFFRHADNINKKLNFMSNNIKLPKYNLYLRHAFKRLKKRFLKIF